ncbi:hypothetical protein BOTCAL_0009g00260 [Botryotinia calthae]|uniref:Uncharacterized protein n=1 Tax=Botryotinia calthae TaxID=38488 RepID=A0A4Y8DIV9_9HELO|nr:hypothetical protein BOTCAL_0009g00260 [Botryotinia calthae]
MVNSRTNGNKRARTDAPAQDDVNDDIDNAMAIIRNRLFAKALEIESLEARVKQMSKESRAAMSRFQQLSNDNAVLEEENEDQSKKIEKLRLQLSSIRKEMEKSISRAEERCKQFSVSNAEKDVLIAWYKDKAQSLSIDKTSSITRAKELHRRVAEGWDNRAEIGELTKANLKELVGK